MFQSWPTHRRQGVGSPILLTTGTELDPNKIKRLQPHETRAADPRLGKYERRMRFLLKNP